jgi:hypothetical protein
MQSRTSCDHELYTVDMLIRALSEEMVQMRNYKASDDAPAAVLTQMEEALYGLRLRKMVLSVLN